ncbi:hypothetical protein [Streptomyces griseoloalbus]|uniref:hypothetical protein n=1 Tax=Streptomyces griseoloalbus TaxID=67303 RepID=UPI0018772C54
MKQATTARAARTSAGTAGHWAGPAGRPVAVVAVVAFAVPRSGRAFTPCRAGAVRTSAATAQPAGTAPRPH